MTDTHTLAPALGTVRHSDVRLRRWTPLLAGYDDGRWTLPDDVVAAARVLVVLAVTPEPPTPSPAEVRERLLWDAVQPGSAGVGDLAPLLQAEAARREHSELVAILNDARRTAGTILDDLLTRRAEDILQGDLRPVHDRLVAEATDAAGKVTTTDAHALLRAGAAAREGYLALGDIAEGLAAVHAAASACRGLHPDRDADLLRWLAGRNLDEVAPSLFGNVPLSGVRVPPWPTEDPVDRLRWQIAHGLELWLPTTAELRARHAEHVEAHNALLPVTHGRIGD